MITSTSCGQGAQWRFTYQEGDKISLLIIIIAIFWVIVGRQDGKSVKWMTFNGHGKHQSSSKLAVIVYISRGSIMGIFYIKHTAHRSHFKCSPYACEVQIRSSLRVGFCAKRCVSSAVRVMNTNLKHSCCWWFRVCFRCLDDFIQNDRRDLLSSRAILHLHPDTKWPPCCRWLFFQWMFFLCFDPNLTDICSQ